jgi:hypothetical protein
MLAGLNLFILCRLPEQNAPNGIQAARYSPPGRDLLCGAFGNPVRMRPIRIELSLEQIPAGANRAHVHSPREYNELWLVHRGSDLGVRGPIQEMRTPHLFS